MLTIVLCIVFVIFKADAFKVVTGNAEINLDYNYDRNENFTVWKDKPLDIVIKNANARLIWCSNYYKKAESSFNTKFVPDTIFRDNDVYILHVPKVTTKMSTRWTCTVLQDYHGPAGSPYKYNGQTYTGKDLHFHLYVRGERHVTLSVRNQELIYNLTTDLSLKYYGVANYTYNDGEDIKFACKKSQNNLNDTLQLEYFNAEGVPLFRTQHRTKLHQFHSTLKLKNDKYYLDCIYASTNPGREFRYRTIFYIKNDNMQRPISVSVDGQKLATLNYSDKYNNTFIFSYIHGENLNVTCEKANQAPKGPLEFSIDSNIRYLNDINRRMNFVSLKLLASNIKDRTLSCYINTTSKIKPTAKIWFLPEIPDKDLRIRGLPRRNILYQYTNDEYQWIIEYEYTVNEGLGLICVANTGFTVSKSCKSFFQWKFRGEVYNVPAKCDHTLPAIEFSDTYTLILNASHNGNNIKCTYRSGTNTIDINKSVGIIFRLKSDFVSNEISNYINSEDDFYVKMIVPLTVSFVVTVAIVAMVSLVCWRKRTKRLNLIENANNSFSDQNDGSIPAFPSQWDTIYDDSHYSKIDEGVMEENTNYARDEDKLYSLPYQQISNSCENHYTEIYDHIKHEPDRILGNRNSPQTSHYKKDTNTSKGINFKQDTYDKLVENLKPINKSNENYSNVQIKNKTVRFKQISSDLRLGGNNNEGNSWHDRNNDHRLKQNNESPYINIQ